MFIVIPHQRPAHFGHACITGDWTCDADCAGCREMNDSHHVLGDHTTSAAELRAMAIAYAGHQEHRVHVLATQID